MSGRLLAARLMQQAARPEDEVTGRLVGTGTFELWRGVEYYSAGAIRDELAAICDHGPLPGKRLGDGSVDGAELYAVLLGRLRRRCREKQ